MTTLKPLEDRLIVRRIEAEEKVGLIIIPDANKQPQQIGEIVAAGPGIDKGEGICIMAVAIGDRIMFGKYSGTDIKLNREDLTIIRETDVLAIVVED